MDTLNFKAKIAYQQLIRWRIGKLRKIYGQFLLWILCTSLVLIEKFVDIPHVEINLGNNEDNYLYAILLIWLICLVVKMILHYAEYLPFLKHWQDKQERKEFTRIKSTYEYQMKNI